MRRNHSVQYISFPDFPWQLLRKEFPEKYESYVDLLPGEWTKVKIEVRGDRARLYVNGAQQPNLLVNVIAESMNQALIPTLIRVKIRQGGERAQQVLSSSMLWLCGLLIAASLVTSPLATP